MDKDPRAIAQQEITEALMALDVGLPGTDQRRRFQETWRWVEDQKREHDARKERRTASLAGIFYGILGTAVTASLTWFTGILQWALSTFPSRH